MSTNQIIEMLKGVKKDKLFAHNHLKCGLAKSKGLINEHIGTMTRGTHFRGDETGVVWWHLSDSIYLIFSWIMLQLLYKMGSSVHNY